MTWNAITVPYDLDALDEETERKYSLRDPEGRRYQLTSLLHPEQGRRPNLDYDVMGVRRTWRWSKERMQRAITEGKVVQTAAGRVPREKRYLDEQEGRSLGDIWTDISPINSQAAERLGYPTQKPVALLNRIIKAGSNPGDLVLDPFCGCGTTVAAAQAIGRRWIGIDITYIAIDLMEKRLRKTYGSTVDFVVHGIPRDLPGAEALFQANPFDFERWAVSLVHGQPNEKQVGDKGFDGVIRFPVVGKGSLGRVLVSVKGGRQIGRRFVQELAGAIDEHSAEMGVLIILANPTRGMIDAANHAGTYTWPVNNQSYPKVQVVTIEQLLNDYRLEMPPSLTPYLQAARNVAPSQQMDLGEVAEPPTPKQDWSVPPEFQGYPEDRAEAE